MAWCGRARREADLRAQFDPHAEVWELPRFQNKHPEAAKIAEEMRKQQGGGTLRARLERAANAAPGGQVPAGGAEKPEHAPAQPAAVGTTNTPMSAAAQAAEKFEIPPEAWPLQQAGLITERASCFAIPPRGHVFFSIYFFMTGLHGFHVLAGIVVWVWLLRRAALGQFGPKYFGPIDFAALYWHLVDLIWIYLFPLLYLIA